MVALVFLVLVGTASADPGNDLAQKFAPVVKIVEQQEPCGHGEPFLPSRWTSSSGATRWCSAGRGRGFRVGGLSD